MTTPHRKLLIVEDSQGWNDQMAGLLRDRFPYNQIITATSLIDAQKEIATHIFDIAIVDVRLDDSNESNQDGVVVAAEIRERSPHTKIFFLTGYATLTLVQKAMRPDKDGKALIDDFFEKSDTPDLIARIEQIWGK